MIERDYARFQGELEELAETPTPLLIRAIVRLWGPDLHSVVIPLQEESGYQVYLQAWKTSLFYTNDHPKHCWALVGLGLDRLAKHLELPLKKVIRKILQEIPEIEEQRWLEVDAGVIECS